MAVHSDPQKKGCSMCLSSVISNEKHKGVVISKKKDLLGSAPIFLKSAKPKMIRSPPEIAVRLTIIFFRALPERNDLFDVEAGRLLLLPLLEG